MHHGTIRFPCKYNPLRLQPRFHLQYVFRGVVVLVVVFGASCCPIGLSKIGAQNGSLVNGSKDYRLRSPGWFDFDPCPFVVKSG